MVLVHLGDSNSTATVFVESARADFFIRVFRSSALARRHAPERMAKPGKRPKSRNAITFTATPPAQTMDGEGVRLV